MPDAVVINAGAAVFDRVALVISLQALATACAAGMAACLGMLWYVAPGRRRPPPLEPA